MNLLRRKEDRKTNEDGDSIYIGLATAVAAAAFAVGSLEQGKTVDNNNAKRTQHPNRFSFNKIKSGAQNLTRQTTNENQKTQTQTLSSSSNEPTESESGYRRNRKLKTFISCATAKKVTGKGKKG